MLKEFRKKIPSSKQLSTLLLFVVVLGSMSIDMPNAHGLVSATGGTISYANGYKIHTFTSGGTFTVTTGGDIWYLLVGGGGGTGGNASANYGSGGGAGGEVVTGVTNIANGTHTITIGAGGSGSTYVGTDGGDTTAGTAGLDTAYGGGHGSGVYGGGSPCSTVAGGNSKDAGSPGGGAGVCQNNNSGSVVGGTGTHAGGNGSKNCTGRGGAGGSSAEAGNNGACGAGAGVAGSLGIYSEISGSNTCYGGGGSGGASGGYADGAAYCGAVSGGAGTANTGGGAGGKNSGGSGNVGGSGIAIFAYDQGYPVTPNNLYVNSTDDTQITLSWDLPYEKDFLVTGYKIEREVTVGGGWGTLIADTGTTLKTYTDNAVSPNQEYNYRVSSINSVGTSNPSMEIATRSIPTDLTDLNVDTFDKPFTEFGSGVSDELVLMDIDKNGKVDNIYSYSPQGQNLIFTHLYGQSFGNQTTVSLTASYGVQNVNPDGDIIYVSSGYASGTTCYMELDIFNVTSGVVTNNRLTTSHAAGGTATLDFATGMFDSNDNLPTFHTHCGGTTDRYLVFNDAGNVYYQASGTSSTAENFNSVSSWSNIGGSNHLISTDGSDLAVNPGAAGGANTVVCGTFGCVTADGTTLKPIPTIQAANVETAGTVQLYLAGLEMPNGQTLETKETLFTPYLPTFSNDDSLIFAMLYREVFKSGMTNEYYRFIFDDGVSKFVGYIDDDTIFMSPSGSDTFPGRTLGFYLPERDPDTFDTTNTSSNMTITYFTHTHPAGSWTVATHGLFSMISGYELKPNPTVIRSLSTEANQDPTYLVPWTIGDLTSLSSLIISVSNAPNNAALDLRDTTMKTVSQKTSWVHDTLQADKSLTAEFVSGKCVDVFIKDLDAAILSWDSLGTICNSGTMPKALIYSQNLAFTFWTLEWGAAHEYDQDITTLETKVRNTNENFDYTVNLYHNNGSLASTNPFSASTTTYDSQVFNTTALDLPSRLEVLDNNGDIIYYATIGYPNYFASINSYFTQWFTVDGFNLMYMLPIIFAAMFTRSSVGIGSALTVTFIAFLAWSGLIVIDETIIYALIFVAIIGMLAYRQLRG